MAGETGEAAGAGLRRFPTRPRALIGGIAAIVCIAVVLNVVGGGDGLSSIDGSQPTRSYAAVFLLVFLDAVSRSFRARRPSTPRLLPPRRALSSSGRSS